MSTPSAPAIPDSRHLANGREIPTESYSDQPYIVQTDDGAWLCCVTTGAGHEGEGGQHVISLRSTDQGRTWSAPVDVEPASGPEASYAVMLKVPAGCAVSAGSSGTGRGTGRGTDGSCTADRSPVTDHGVATPPAGRIYIFYNHNTDNVREVLCHDGKTVYKRVDSLGHFVFKYSDDHGRTWSPQRYDIPIRLFQCDRENVYSGQLCFFWNVGKPFVLNGSAYVSLHKVGQMGNGFFQQSEGVLLKSTNLLTEPDPAKIRWETLPDGDIGLRTPQGGGPIAEEQSYSVLSDGSFYCVYRSIDGYPVESYSRDGGRTWSQPRYKRYADGRLMKHPRAANFAWRCTNGKFLYWFHNHGGRVMREAPHCALGGAYEDRNPVWLSGGEEVDTPAGREIRWFHPEIVLYDDDPYVRISYPDLVEEGGRYYLTETQKDVARAHEIDPALLAGLWGDGSGQGAGFGVQGNESDAKGGGLKVEGAGTATPDTRTLTLESLLLDLPQGALPMPREQAMPALPAFLERDHQRADYGTKDLRRGFTIDAWIELPELIPGTTLLDSRMPTGQGLALLVTANGAVELVLNDGRTENRWECDPGQLRPGRRQNLVAVVDGGPKLILFVVDGMLNDGGEQRQFGWGRFSPNLRHANGGNVLRVSPAVSGLRIYDRALRVFEVIAAWRANRDGR